MQSYHDVSVRLEPIILELEREQNDLLIIAHESVLRVLYGYLMACDAADIPFLSFPRDEIIEVGHLLCFPLCSSFPFPCSSHHWTPANVAQIIPASYNNEAKRIKIPDLPREIVPASPEGPKAAAPPSGFTTPVPGLGAGTLSPRTKPGTPEPSDGGRTPVGAKTPAEQAENDISIRIHDVV